MTRDELTAFYGRYNACCNAHRFDDLAEFVAPRVVINGAEHRRDTYAENLRGVVRGFPDFRWDVRQILVEAPWLAVRLQDTGTHTATFRDVPATGRSVATEEFAFYRVEAGLIVEVWGTAFGERLLDGIR